MSSLVDSTYRALISRLQRGGTNTRPAHRPDTSQYKWGFIAYVPDGGPEICVQVEVGLLTRNVYKSDKVEITVTDPSGFSPFKTFEPISGNCPPIDAVEAFIRSALAVKMAAPHAPAPLPEPEVSSLKHEPVEEVPAEPERPAQSEETHNQTLSRRDKRSRGRRVESAPGDEAQAVVEPSEVRGDQAPGQE